MNEDVEAIVLVIDDRHGGDRLDRALAALLPEVSRASIQKHIERDAVTIDGALPTRGAKSKVTVGQTVVYTPPPPETFDLQPEDIPLSILFEDEHYVAVDKPAGMVVHPSLGHPNGTLVNAVLHHVQTLSEMATNERPGIVHRLDRGTTGVIVVAKHIRAHELLAGLFRDRKIDKRYLAITKGVPSPKADTIDTLHGRHPRERQRFSSKVTTGKRAVTSYETQEVFDGAALLTVHLHTGRTHQIRVHLADRGHPLLGDELYRGTKLRNARLEAAVGDFDRPALHAFRLGFDHPIEDRRIELEAPVPEDFIRLCERLR